MRTTTRLNLIVWDSNSDEYDHNDLVNNWDSLEALLRPMQAGTITVPQAGYTSTAIGGQTILNKTTTLTFPTAFEGIPIVTGSTDLLGTWLTVAVATTTQVALTVNTLRNDSATFGTVTIYWHAIQP